MTPPLDKFLHGGAPIHHKSTPEPRHKRVHAFGQGPDFHGHDVVEGPIGAAKFVQPFIDRHDRRGWHGVLSIGGRVLGERWVIALWHRNRRRVALELRRTVLGQGDVFQWVVG